MHIQPCLEHQGEKFENLLFRKMFSQMMHSFACNLYRAHMSPSSEASLCLQDAVAAILASLLQWVPGSLELAINLCFGSRCLMYNFIWRKLWFRDSSQCPLLVLCQQNSAVGAADTDSELHAVPHTVLGLDNSEWFSLQYLGSLWSCQTLSLPN